MIPTNCKWHLVVVLLTGTMVPGVPVNITTTSKTMRYRYRFTPVCTVVLVAIHSTGILYSWRCIVSVLLVMAVLSTWSRVEGVHLLPFYFHHSIFYIDNPTRDIPVCTEAPASIILFPLLGCQCCSQFYSTLCLVTRTLNIRSDTSTTISYNSAKKFNISESNLCSL